MYAVRSIACNVRMFSAVNDLSDIASIIKDRQTSEVRPPTEGASLCMQKAISEDFGPLLGVIDLLGGRRPKGRDDKMHYQAKVQRYRRLPLLAQR